MAFIVTQGKCVGCGLCAKTCSFGAIQITGRKAHINENCTSCGMCVTSCKFRAIEFKTQGGADSQCKHILIFAQCHQGEILDVAYELTAKARELAEGKDMRVFAAVIGDISEDKLTSLAHHGADSIYYYHCTENLFDEDYANILATLNQELKPAIMLFGATSAGRSIAPRLAARLKTGLTADCTELYIDGNGLLTQVRPAFGGNLMAAIICPVSRPQMATVRPQVMSKKTPDLGRKAHIISRMAKRDESRAMALLEKTTASEGSSLSDAEIVVAAGKGIGPRKNMDLIHKLAGLLGAQVALSRPLVDMGYGDYTCQVGQTGQTISPKLYISFGVSGAIQHLAGIGGAEKVMAVNTDKNAPIFSVADYGIVGDASSVLKELIALLSEG